VFTPYHITDSHTQKQMADPRRYYIDPVLNPDTQIAGLHTEPAESGDWIKWHDFSDYKASQRRNASAEMNERLGIEIAEMRSRIADLEAERDKLRGQLERAFNENHRFTELVWLNGYRKGGEDKAKGVQS
jgi:hypothetical protein